MDKVHRATDEKLEEMERHLSAIYSRAGKELEKKAAEFFLDFQRLDEEKLQLLQAGKITEAEYKGWRTRKILYEQRFVHLQQQFAEELLHVNETAQAYINDQLPEIYSKNYNAMHRKTAGIKGYSFTQVTPQVIKNLATKDLQLLPYRVIDPSKDIPWNMKKIQSELLQGVLQGDSIPRIAKRLRNVSTMNMNASIRNARTMVTNTENKGRQDSYEKAQADGVIMKKVWRSVSDGRTRHAHRKLNGQMVDIDQPFDSELGPIRFPGDPLAKPANVYNCRCTMKTKIVGFKPTLSEEERKRIHVK